MVYIGIGDVVKLDQKNRLHIPKNVMRIAGIEDNSSVIVSVDVDGGCIKIYRADKYMDGETIKRIEGEKA